MHNYIEKGMVIWAFSEYAFPPNCLYLSKALWAALCGVENAKFCFWTRKRKHEGQHGLDCPKVDDSLSGTYSSVTHLWDCPTSSKPHRGNGSRQL